MKKQEAKKVQGAAAKKSERKWRVKESVTITTDVKTLCRHLGILLDMAENSPSSTPVLMPKWVYEKLTEVFELSEETELGRRSTDGEGNPFTLRLLKGKAGSVLKNTVNASGAKKRRELSMILLRDTTETMQRFKYFTDKNVHLNEEIGRLKAVKKAGIRSRPEGRGEAECDKCK